MFYLNSLPPNAQRLGTAIRQHWFIENQLHWILDVTFGEDACRIRKGNAPADQNLITISLTVQALTSALSNTLEVEWAMPTLQVI